MLEPIILDNTERLLSVGGEISLLSNGSSLVASSSQMVCLGRNSKASFPYSALYKFSALPDTFLCRNWLSAANNVLLVADAGTPFDVLAVNLTTGEMSQDSTGRRFNVILEDSSGVIWANGINAGQYGLWKRAGAGSWTKLLADTGIGYLQRYSNGTIYYISYAGNWYTLANGAATVSQNPLAYAWHTSAWPTHENIICPALSNNPFITGLGTLPNTPGYCGSAGEDSAARYWPINACGQTSGTMIAPLGTINWEMLAECTQPNIPNATTELMADYTLHQFIWLDGTYMLHCAPVSFYQAATSRRPDMGARKLVLTVLNKSTGINKYIGSLYLTGSSTISVSATNAAVIYGNIVGARMTSGVLDLWIAQGTYTIAGSTDHYGLFKKSLTLNLDF